MPFLRAFKEFLNDDQNIFTNKIKDLIEVYKQKQKPSILVGDLNSNYLDYTTNKLL